MKHFSAILALFLGFSAPAPAQEDEVWLFAYFRQRYEGRVEFDAGGKPYQVPLPDPMRVEQLHLAVSEDGRKWEALNDNRPVWEQRIRDPFLKRWKDGRWHLVATGGGRQRNPEDGNAGPVCLHAVSKDLVHWEEVSALPLMRGVSDEEGRRAGNIWAPEWFHDEETGDAVLIWSSSFEDAGWKKSRLWYSRTKDWKTFAPAKVLFEPPYSVIDGTLVKHEDKYYLFHKEEEFSPATGERRAIRLAVADRLEGPYEIHEGPLNGGQISPTIAEGPSVMPDPKGNGWLLLYDYCMSNGYGAASSSDLREWSEEKGTTFPPDARHGGVFKLDRKELERLRAAFAESPR